MKSLPEYLREKRIYANDNLLVEGIIVDNFNKTVLLDDSSKGVDFSKPVYWKTKDHIDVISIFKRTSYNNRGDFDGNPFIYALKNKFGWKFKISKAESYKYMRKFVENCQKLQQTYDTIIMIPSYSDINARFMDALFDISKAKHKIEHFFSKIELNHDEVEQFIDYEKIRQDFADPRDVEIEIEDLLYDLNETGKKFEAKLINKRYLKYIKFLQINDDADSVEQINGKNVLILDDTFSSGTTVSKAVEAIKSNYDPKSITVVTLLSKKF